MGKSKKKLTAAVARQAGGLAVGLVLWPDLGDAKIEDLDDDLSRCGVRGRGSQA